jgi:hypothetical protein
MTARISTDEGKALIGIFPNEICERIDDFVVDIYRDPRGCSEGISWFWERRLDMSFLYSEIRIRVAKYKPQKDKTIEDPRPHLRILLDHNQKITSVCRGWLSWDDQDPYDSFTDKEAKEIIFRARTSRARFRKTKDVSLAKRIRSTFREGADLASWRPKKKLCIREVDL